MTLATPTLSLAVPVTTIELADVEIVVFAGDTIVSDGGVVSGPGDGDGCGFGVGDGGVGLGGAAACTRVTLTACDTRVCCESLASTVMMFAPTFSGIDGIVQVAAACAEPENP